MINFINSCFRSVAACLFVLAGFGYVLAAPDIIENGFTLRSLATQSQLPVSNVYTTFQDSKGYMWYGTIGGGLCRDNGYQIFTFHASLLSQTADADNILCIAEDATGNIWFGTDAGVFCLDGKSLSLSMPHNLKGQCLCMLRSKDDCLWMALGNSIYRLFPDGKSIRHVLTTDLSWRVNSFFQTRDGHMYVLLSGKLAEMAGSDGKEVLRAIETSCPIDPVQMAQDVSGDLWIATWNQGIVHFDPITGEIASQSITQQRPDQSRCLSMLIDHMHGLMWSNSHDNLYVYRIEDERLIPFKTESFCGQEQKIMGLLYEDAGSNIWVPSFIPHSFVICPKQGGIRRVTIDTMRSLTGYPLIPDRVVMDGQNMWIHQGRVGLMHYNQTTQKLSRVSGADYNKCIVKENGGAGLLAADGSRMVRFSADNPCSAIPLATFPEDITQMLDAEDGRVYVATRHGIFAYSRTSHSQRKLCETDGDVTDMCMQSHRLYYIVKGHGLYQLDTHKDLKSIQLMASPFLSALALSTDCTLWIVGHNGCVYSMSNGEIQLHREMQSENGTPLIDVSCDNRGHVWTLSNQCVREYNPRNYAFRSVTNSQLNMEYFFHFEEAGADSIGLGGVGAMCIFPSSPELDRLSASEHTPRITSILLGDSVVVWNDEARRVDIPCDQGTVGFHVSTLDVLNANHISYAYRIMELDTNWVYLPRGINTFHINYLPYGDSHLQLKSTDASGCWQMTVGTTVLHHERPWWLTWWACLLYLLFIAVPLYALWLTSKRVRKLRLLHKQRRELALTEIASPSQQEIVSERDKAFLASARDCVERNLTDVQYNVEALASDMCMSRSNLHRRLQPLTGMTPVEFIRDIRLKHAAQILKEHPDTPVVEVVKRVGFASSSYFTKRFKERFGVLPTQWNDGTNVEKP